MRIRTATADDAPALGRVMVESWLAAHRGQMPDVAWQKRADEWTPEVSARGWARVLDSGPSHVLLVAEDRSGTIDGLVFGTPSESPATTAEIRALYVRPDAQGHGVGSALLRAAASELAGLGFVALRVDVLSANLPARRFYEAMGARGVGRDTFDEEGHSLPVTVYEWSDGTSLEASTLPRRHREDHDADQPRQ